MSADSKRRMAVVVDLLALGRSTNRLPENRKVVRKARPSFRCSLMLF